MLRKLFTPITAQDPAHREGELYKVIAVHGRSFEIRYGYYEDIDRQHEPIAIYPDFIKKPIYTDDGIPFATQMQDICEHYSGNAGEDCCSGCAHFQKSAELLGLCTCETRRKTV